MWKEEDDGRTAGSRRSFPSLGRGGWGCDPALLAGKQGGPAALPPPSLSPSFLPPRLPAPPPPPRPPPPSRPPYLFLLPLVLFLLILFLVLFLLLLIVFLLVVMMGAMFFVLFQQRSVSKQGVSGHWCHGRPASRACTRPQGSVRDDQCPRNARDARNLPKFSCNARNLSTFIGQQRKGVRRC